MIPEASAYHIKIYTEDLVQALVDISFKFTPLACWEVSLRRAARNLRSVQ